MAESVINNYFPSQVVSDAEKLSYDYGLKIGKAIESEWFNKDRGHNRYTTNQNNFHNLRLYASGNQSIQKYKDELSINGDLSYLNLDWTPVPIIPKFVDIVVNGIAERMYDIKAYSQDPYGVAKRTEYMESILGDMQTQEMNDFAQEAFGVNLYDNYELIKKRFYYDLTVLGIGAVKTGFTTSEGVTIDYVDPADLVYSYTESPYFDDVYYVGEVKTIPVNELAKQFPHLTQSDLEDIIKNKSIHSNNYHGHSTSREIDNNQVQILYFNFKSYMNEVYKMKETGSGALKAIEKEDTFNPPADKEGGYENLLSEDQSKKVLI